MPGTFLLSGGFPGRKRNPFHPAEIGRNRQKCRKPPKNADQEGGVTVTRTRRRGAVSMLRFDSTYTLNTKDTKDTRNIYCTNNARYFPCVFGIFGI